jgi:DNA-binding MarR family transcriptional regulator
MADKVRVTVKEKILIHLFGFSKFRDDFEVPQKVTQDGMAKVIGVRRSHIASALKDLKTSEFVEERKARVEGNDRRKNAYFLTPQGEIESLKIKEAVLEKQVLVTLEDGTSKEVKISEIGEHIEKKMGLMEILSCISPQGEFKEKEEEKVEPEKTVICPFCAHTNFNFEMNEVQISESEKGVLVACLFCGMEFLAKDKMDPEDPGTFLALPPPPMQVPQMLTPQTGKPFLVVLGLFFMMGSFILALLVGLSEIPSEFCLMAPLGFILSLIVIYVGLKDVKHLEAMTRRVLILTGTIFVSFVALFVALILGAEFDLERAGTLALVVFPAFGVFAFGKPLSSNLRSELSLSLGVFLALFGVFLSGFSDLLQWSIWYSPFWVIAGSTLIFVSYEVHKLDNLLITRSICVGAGAFCAIFCMVLLNTWRADLGTYRVIGILLWFIFCVFLILLRFVPLDVFKEMLYALKTSLLAGIGLLFMLVAVVLGIKGRLMEAGVEFFLGIPIIWYGFQDSRRFGYAKIGLILYVMASEIIAVLAFILT